MFAFLFLGLTTSLVNAAAVSQSAPAASSTAVAVDLETKAVSLAWQKLDNATTLVEMLGLQEGEQVPDSIIEPMLGITPAHSEDSLVERASRVSHTHVSPALSMRTGLMTLRRNVAPASVLELGRWWESVTALARCVLALGLCATHARVVSASALKSGWNERTASSEREID